jgi:hypothetical protein
VIWIDFCLITRISAEVAEIFGKPASEGQVLFSWALTETTENLGGECFVPAN